MSNITVSSDVDTMLQSADNAAIRSNIGLTSSPTFLGLSIYKLIKELKGK